MVRRHYPVLAQISLSYSEPKGRFPRVTHPCATNPEGFVRLACVRHAASVRSEPGSNSQVCVTIQRPRSKTARPKHRTSGADTCTCQTYGYEGHIRYRLTIPVTGAQRPPDRAPSPTCPFIKNLQCQRTTNTLPSRQELADNHRSPFLATRGTSCPSLLATASVPVKSGVVRCGERPSKSTP